VSEMLAGNEKGFVQVGDFITSSPQPKPNRITKVKN